MPRIKAQSSFISISDMKNRVLPFVFGFVLAALLAELMLHAFPVSTGYNFGAVDAAHPILRGAPYSRYTYSKDWSFHLANSGVLNNFGFRASYDYQPNPNALVMIGNSFIQADAIDARDTITERIGALLHRPAYDVGVDGFSLADYLEAARWASGTFNSRTILILLTTGDLSHSCTLRTGAHYLRLANGTMTMMLVDRAPQSRLKRWLNESKMFRYLYDNLHAATNWSKGWRHDEDDAPNPDGLAAVVGCTDAQFQTAATQFLLKSFRDIEIARNARVIFVLAPGYRREQLVAAGGTRDVDVFARRAALDGFAIVHLEAAFSAALRSGTRLDFLPIDGHWNAAAHAIAAQVAADAISADLGTPRIDEAN
jgi:hypothetical protein